jgi:hypothetical protein
MKEKPILKKLSKWLRVSRPYLERFLKAGGTYGGEVKLIKHFHAHA